MLARLRAITTVLVVITPLAVACSGSSRAADGRIDVVTSTDVYGDIVATIGGDHADVTSLINDPAEDPHSFQASARDQLAMSEAELVVENGGGYDDFVDRMRAATGKKGAKLVDVVALSGKTAPAGGQLNEHVWYDLPTVAILADTIAADLAAIQPRNAAAFRANAETLRGKLAKLEQTEAAIRATDGGAGVAITEPVPLYLLQACGLVNRTPPRFSAAVEDGTGVSASVLDTTLGLFRDRAVRALVYNDQTSGPETTKLIAAAEAAGIATVPVTETLPSHQGYLAWMSANLGALREALQR